MKEKSLIQNAAIHVGNQARELCNLESRVPTSIAAAAIYLVCTAAGYNKTRIGKDNIRLIFTDQSVFYRLDVGQATGCSESVIRDIYKKMLPSADKLFPQGFVFKRPINQLPKA